MLKQLNPFLLLFLASCAGLFGSSEDSPLAGFKCQEDTDCDVGVPCIRVYNMPGITGICSPKRFQGTVTGGMSSQDGTEHYDQTFEYDENTQGRGAIGDCVVVMPMMKVNGSNVRDHSKPVCRRGSCCSFPHLAAKYPPC